MRTVICEKCGQSVPQNDALLVRERPMCEACATALLQGEENVPETSVSRTPDPTVCGICGHDAGTTILPTIAETPVCSACEEKFRNRQFPLWVKAALAVVLLLTVVAMVRNYRFFRGYRAAKQATRAAVDGNFLAAAQFMDTAASAIPEVGYYPAGASLYRGLNFLKQDQPAAALPLLKDAERVMPANPGVQTFVLQAEVGTSFEAADYGQMVEKATRLSELNPDQKMLKLGIASAYACLYASKGDEDARRQATDRLPTGEERATLAEDEKAFVNRIEHRLATREIIRGDEFARRYPQGWKPETNSP